ncbi:spermatogenesis-associated protein 7 isoform X3 [Pseudonaja textilis]|uniref:spermatogenesis-associated protein 7 isoform X3 n=1 Tax=Pseudonaja textilis TaxID=8673 RepID=UPI000EAA42D7|nr:spermatogenesis-associated protein 7 isoform X3 [Pseudonaja textilis]
MGVRMDESGERRRRRSSPVIEYLTIPRYGLASPFKGHLSTKSNAFCIDSSSRRLSNQYLIRDHMAVHYNKILSAKAAIDCSLPKSRLNSIKFSDQQQREKLKKEVEKCEKEMISSQQVSRSSSRESRRLLSATYTKVEDSQFSNEQKSDEMKTVSQLSSPRAISPCSVESPTMRKIQAEEEELRYLNFIQDITDEILKLGLFSNRALERLFERHVELNKNHLNKNKMRHLLEILKVDLGCNREENSAGVSDAYGHLQNESAEHLQLTSISESKVSKSEELLNAADLITSDLTVHNDKFQRMEDQDAISQDIKDLLNIELNPPSMKTAETPDNTYPLPPTCNSATCNADFETSESLREVDELKESMMEPISLVEAQE